MPFPWGSGMSERVSQEQVWPLLLQFSPSPSSKNLLSVWGLLLSSQALFSLGKPEHSLPAAGKPKPSTLVNEGSPERKQAEKASCGGVRHCAGACCSRAVPWALPPLQPASSGRPWSDPSWEHCLLFFMTTGLWAVLPPNKIEAFVVGWLFPRPVCKVVYARKEAFKFLSVFYKSSVNS